MTSSLEEAEATLFSDRKKDFSGALLDLHRAGGPRADAAVMGFVTRLSALDHLDDLYEPDLHGLAIRVAAELDPDRDVEPFRDLLEPRPPKNRLVRKVMSWGALAYPDTFPRSAWGYTRLRRLTPPPVERYTLRLGADSATVRVSAAMALGDTADPAALDPLADVLDDPSTDVRLHAVQSVRRLHHAAAASVLDGHPAEAGLVEALGDRRPQIRDAAVQTLMLWQRSELVHQAASTADAALAESLRHTLTRAVDPLPQTWPGDSTTL
ncbi:HEAT repeat protein [Streptomyces sp. YIM 121038]|uniref:HEAT repeat domain-containing protein n=1 Tax=Streptomyces sp. YIM 121038 TaxID=2136401 RepID=UPI001110ED03|nr:HEAT repeat domain-containing protein [Streptomyces sp. YIM 121038]QCX74051.1 HEAT repeat protein [Streptomyces sp. YIM 121038]